VSVTLLSSSSVLVESRIEMRMRDRLRETTAFVSVSQLDDESLHLHPDFSLMCRKKSLRRKALCARLEEFMKEIYVQKEDVRICATVSERNAFSSMISILFVTS